MILPANHLRDAHFNIVNHDRKVVERMTVGSQQYQILDLRIVALLRTVDDVFEVCFAFARDFQANSKLFAGRSAPIRFRIR